MSRGNKRPRVCEVEKHPLPAVVLRRGGAARAVGRRQFRTGAKRTPLNRGGGVPKEVLRTGFQEKKNRCFCVPSRVTRVACVLQHALHQLHPHRFPNRSIVQIERCKLKLHPSGHGQYSNSARILNNITERTSFIWTSEDVRREVEAMEFAEWERC